MNDQHHQSELDILIIIAAISVVLFHYTFRGYAADNMSTLHFPVLGSIFKYGYLGTYSFLILSGYKILLSAQNRSVFAFILSRTSRLYPSFWIAVCLTTSATLIWGGNRYHIEPLQFIINLTMLSGYVGIESVDSVYWFMFVVLRFYFLVAVLIMLRIVNYHKYIAGIWLALSLVIVLNPIPKIGFFLISDYSSLFISGMIFCSAKKEGWDLYKSIIITIAFLFSLYQIEQGVPGFNKHYGADLSLFVVFLIVLFIYIIMLFASINKKHIKLSSAFITLALCTYPLYLIHQNIGFMLFNNYGNAENKYIILAATIFLMLFMSLTIVKYIDPYLVNAINKIVRSVS